MMIVMIVLIYAVRTFVFWTDEYQFCCRLHARPDRIHVASFICWYVPFLFVFVLTVVVVFASLLLCMRERGNVHIRKTSYRKKKKKSPTTPSSKSHPSTRARQTEQGQNLRTRMAKKKNNRTTEKKKRLVLETVNVQSSSRCGKIKRWVSWTLKDGQIWHGLV